MVPLFNTDMQVVIKTRRGQCVTIFTWGLALRDITFTNNICMFWSHRLKVSPPKFLFTHAATIGPPFMHYFFMSGLLNFKEVNTFMQHLTLSFGDYGHLNVKCRVLTKYIIYLSLSSSLFLSVSSTLSYSLTSVSVAGRPHWRSYRRSTLKPTSCCTEPTHCGRN